MPLDRVIKLYNSQGMHIFSIRDSILLVEGADLTTPRGELLFTGIDPDLWRTLREFLPMEITTV